MFKVLDKSSMYCYHTVEKMKNISSLFLHSNVHLCPHFWKMGVFRVTVFLSYYKTVVEETKQRKWPPSQSFCGTGKRYLNQEGTYFSIICIVEILTLKCCTYVSPLEVCFKQCSSPFCLDPSAGGNFIRTTFIAKYALKWNSGQMSQS